MAEEEKKAFFKELYELDDTFVDDDIGDTSNIGVVLREFKRPPSKLDPKSTKGARLGSRTFERTFSSPFPQASVSFPGTGASGKDSMPAAGRSSPLAPSALSIANLSKNKDPGLDHVIDTQKRKAISTRPGSKKLRVQSFNVLPESQQIFRSLAFCKTTFQFLEYIVQLTVQTSFQITTLPLRGSFAYAKLWSMVLCGSKNGEMASPMSLLAMTYATKIFRHSSN